MLYFSPRNELNLRIFNAAFCFGYLFGELISNNKLLFPKVYLQFFALLQLAVLSAVLHVKTSYTTDGALSLMTFQMGLEFFRTYCYLFCISI